MIYLAVTVTHAVCIINTSQCLIIAWKEPTWTESAHCPRVEQWCVYGDAAVRLAVHAATRHVRSCSG